MLGSNTNKLVYVGVTLGVVGVLGVGANELFPNAFTSTKTKLVSLTSSFASTPSVLNRAEMTKPYSIRSLGTTTLDYIKSTKPEALGDSAITQLQKSVDENVTQTINNLSDTTAFLPVSSVGLTSNTNLSGSDVYVSKAIYYVIAGDKSVVNDISDVKSGTKYNVGLIFEQKTSLNGQPDVKQSISNLWVDGSTINQLVSDDGFTIVQHSKYNAEGDSRWDKIYADTSKTQEQVVSGLFTTQELTTYYNLPELKLTLGIASFGAMVFDNENWNYATLSDFYSND